MGTRGRSATTGLVFVAALVSAVTALGATVYTDPAGDVKKGASPDVVSVQLSHTRSHVAFTVQFAHVPPLHVDARGAWIDMLLVGLDVPPLGPRPVSPGGEWRGADYALGAHGPSRRGTLVRLAADGRGRVLGRVDVVGHGSSLRFSIPRRGLGNPTMFTFVVSAARERTEAPGGTFDVVPDRGTFRYSLVR